MTSSSPVAVLVADFLGFDQLPRDWEDAAAEHGGRRLERESEELVLAFPDVPAALSFAKRLQYGETGELFHVPTARVGIDIREEQAHPAPPDRVAARLCARAEPGQVLVSHAVHALALGRPGYEFREAGTLEAENVGDPILAWELLWREQEPRTRIRLCGSFELVVDGRDLAASVPAGQAGSLLCYLVAQGKRGADREELIDVLWPERPPKDPQADLRVVLSRLRRALAAATLEGRKRLRLRPPEPVWVDVEEATTAIQAARAAAKSGRWQIVREQSEAGLELLGPGFLPDVDAQWADERRRELEELELEALEWIARSSLESGGADLRAVESASRSLIARAPYRETGYRFLIEALAAGGNVAEALRVYDQLRVLLRDELGAAPAAEVQELHKRLLSGGTVGSAPVSAHPPGEARERVPLPSLLSPRERSAFVGREQELEVLRAAWQQARSGSRRLALVLGEAGIGKTRLTSEFALEVHDQGTVLYAGCQEEALLSYQPIVEALRHYARSSGLDWGSVDLGPGAAELARLIPELAAAQPTGHAAPGDPETRRYLLFEAVAMFLSEASSRAPLVLVLDDLHWADKATLHLLRHVVRSPHESSLLIVGTYREAEVGDEHPLTELLADLRRDRLSQRVLLDGLDEGDVATLIASHAGHEASAGLVEIVHEQTEGNPFFVEEVMRHLIETGVLFERGGRWVSARTLDEIGVPEGIREVLARRLGRLSETCRTVLSHAAVLGRQFSFEVLRSMVDSDEDALIAALEEAVAAQLVVEARGRSGPAFAFTHALVREALYGGLSGPRRQRLHARAALATEKDVEGSLAELAHHWYCAGDHRRALAAAVEAGIAVGEIYAHAEALTQYEHALELWDLVGDPERLVTISRVELGARAAEAASCLGEPQRAAWLIEEALEHVDPAQDPMRAGSLRERLGRYRWIGGDTERALAAYEEAVHIVPSAPPSVERARVLAALAHALLISNLSEAARARSAEALAMARAVGAPIEEGRALATLGAATATFADPEHGRRMVLEGRALLERAGAAPDFIFVTYAFEASVLEDGGRFEDAVEAARRGIEFTRGHGMYRNHQGWLEALAASALIKLGRWGEAAETLEAALLRGPTGITRRAVQLLRADLQLARGDLDGASESAAEGERAARGDHPFAGRLFDVLAGIALARGDFDAAREHVTRGLAALAPLDEPNAEARIRWRGLRTEADRAESARARNRPADAERAVAIAASLFEPLRDSSRVDGPAVDAELGPLHGTCEAELARASGAADPGAWVAASAAWESLGEPYPRAYCLFRAAEVALNGPGATTEAAALLRRALDVAMRLGAAPLADAIASVASRR